MSDMSSFLNAFSDSHKDAREQYHVQLDGLIKALSQTPPDYMVVLNDTGQSLDNGHSYRGYYSDLAFEPVTYARTVAEFLAECKDCLDKTFVGWKGGDFKMTSNTALWCANKGDGGLALLNTRVDDKKKLFIVEGKELE